MWPSTAAAPSQTDLSSTSRARASLVAALAISSQRDSHACRAEKTPSEAALGKTRQWRTSTGSGRHESDKASSPFNRCPVGSA